MQRGCSTITLIVTACIALPATASPLYWVQSSIQAAATLVPTLTADSGQVQTTSVTSGPIGYSLVDSNGVRQNSINATAAIGHLSGANLDSSSWTNFLYSATTQVNFVAFFDTVTITSASLPNGTNVNVQFNLSMTDNLFAVAGTCCSNTGAHGQFALSGLNLGDQASGTTISHTQNASILATMQVGVPFDVGGFMDLNATTANLAQAGASSSSLDALFSMVLLTPNTTCTSASGAFCGSTVGGQTPEPAAGWLVAVPLALAGLKRARRRQKPAPKTENDAQ